MQFLRRFGRSSFVHFQALMMKKLRYKYYNKRVTTRDNDNALTHDKITKSIQQQLRSNYQGRHHVNFFGGRGGRGLCKILDPIIMENIPTLVKALLKQNS